MYGGFGFHVSLGLQGRKGEMPGESTGAASFEVLDADFQSSRNFNPKTLKPLTTLQSRAARSNGIVLPRQRIRCEATSRKKKKTSEKGNISRNGCPAYCLNILTFILPQCRDHQEQPNLWQLLNPEPLQHNSFNGESRGAGVQHWYFPYIREPKPSK